MSHNIDVLQRDGILESQEASFKRGAGQYIQEFDNQITMTETCKLPITIVFWDISGFSRLAKMFYELDQEEIMLEFLEKYYRTARKVITKNNGVWDKAIGDGVMSWFGSFDYGRNRASAITRSSASTDDEGALDAIKAAIELRNDFKVLKEELKNEWASRLKALSKVNENNTKINYCKKGLIQSMEAIKQESEEIDTSSKNKCISNSNSDSNTTKSKNKSNSNSNSDSNSDKASQIIPQLSDFDLKCGINTGAARVCLLYNQFTAVGTNVNFASRLQEFAKLDQIVISSSTERKIRNEKVILRKIIIGESNPIKSFEDIECCYEIL